MNIIRVWWEWLMRLFRFLTPSESDSEHAAAVRRIEINYGIRLIESDPKGNARRWRPAELAMLTETLGLLGPAFYAAFHDDPIKLWIDRKPGGGHFGNGWLRIGEPGNDLSILYRIFLHEATHASNEYRGWPYEKAFCTKPGLDWQKQGDSWVHPCQQGAGSHSGEWETLPVDARDVSTSPGEDLAEMMRYFVHSVRNERKWLWPLDQTKPPLYLWDTSPTRFIYIRDYFLALSPNHVWYKQLSPEIEARVSANLSQ